MRCFPQLDTGASAQYPVWRTLRRRTVTNECGDGRRVKLADAGACETEWRLRFSELTDAEVERLRSFFLECEGRLGSFTFLDPLENLLRWSGKLDEAVWEKGPLLQATADALDARVWHLANAGAAPQAITQRVAAQAQWWYCLSVWVEGSGEATLVCGEQRKDCALRPGWQRLWLAAQGQQPGDAVQFGLELAPGAAVAVFGWQAEAQTSASGYKATENWSGVYERARFDQDELHVATLDVNRHACEVTIVHGDNF